MICTLFSHLDSVAHYPEDRHTSGRNLLVTTMQKSP